MKRKYTNNNIFFDKKIKTNTKITTIDMIPINIISLILSHTELSDILLIKRVCKKWLDACSRHCYLNSMIIKSLIKNLNNINFPMNKFIYFSVNNFITNNFITGTINSLVLKNMFINFSICNTEIGIYDRLYSLNYKQFGKYIIKKFPNRFFEGINDSIFYARGILYISTGDIYRGTINENGNRSGYGIIKYSNDSVYEGQWSDDQIEKK